MKTFIDFCQMDGKELLIPVDKIGAIFKTENGLTTIVVGDQKYAVAESMNDIRNTLKFLQCTIIESIFAEAKAYLQKVELSSLRKSHICPKRRDRLGQIRNYESSTNFIVGTDSDR